ncbi:MAG: 50S ribosomal protein L30 [Candidatus Melainabacteria bacterium]|nr:50S ribosomal protein L30 [Candidatus Melainabacteria bacterium]
MTTSPPKKIRVKLTRSLLGHPEKLRRVAYALGLRKTGRPVEHFATPIIEGMIRKISHLVTVEVTQS